MLEAFAEQVAATRFADWAMSSPMAYPVANTVHVLALVLLLGGIGIVDLRIAGAFRNLSLQALSRTLVPIAAAGLAMLAASGSVMFAADALALAQSGTFRLKLAMIAMALVNILLFRWRFGAVPGDPPNFGMRALAIVSLSLWTAVAIAGRMIAYS